MSLQAVLLPVFVQVALSLALVIWLAWLRTRALDRKEVRPDDIALGQKVWPERIVQIGNSFQNQFELPVLFYLAAIIAILTRKADLAFVILSWIFVVSRLVHAPKGSAGDPFTGAEHEARFTQELSRRVPERACAEIIAMSKDLDNLDPRRLTRLLAEDPAAGG